MTITNLAVSTTGNQINTRAAANVVLPAHSSVSVFIWDQNSTGVGSGTWNLVVANGGDLVFGGPALTTTGGVVFVGVN